MTQIGLISADKPDYFEIPAKICYSIKICVNPPNLRHLRSIYI